jgi:hypothetical protein
MEWQKTIQIVRNALSDGKANRVSDGASEGGPGASGGWGGGGTRQ